MASPKLPTLSIVVMAHDSRAKWFDYLKEKLGDDVPFSVDDDEQKLGTWGNCKRAWSMMDKSADYGLVVQDDAIICDGFVDKAREFIAKHPKKSYQFFYGKRPGTVKELKSSTTKTKGYVISTMKYGVAIALPMNLVEEMIAFGEEQPTSMPDDSRIKRFCASKKLKTYYPFPSLVDHRLSPSLVSGNDAQERRAISYIDRVSIPRTIHQIWVGPKKEPVHWTSTWKNIPGWGYKLWDEAALEQLNMKNRKLYDYYKRKKIWYGMADVARIEILDQFGGMYIDSDTERLKEWQDFAFLDSGFFAVQANTAPKKDYRVANGVMGAVPGHKIIKEYIKRMGEAKTVEPCWNTIGGTLLTQILVENEADDDITILKPVTFYPVNSRGISSGPKRKALAKHAWGATKRLYA